MVYALLFLAGGPRFGEVSALRWEAYDPMTQPLGRLLISRSYSTHKLKEKSVKTEVPRRAPVVPQLAAILAEWKLGGWQEMMGRAPQPEDLIVPSRRGNNRNVNPPLASAV